jgi:hypothetical protein
MNDIVNGRLWAPTPNGEQTLSTPVGPQGAVGIGASCLRVLARCTPFSAVSLSPLRFKISQQFVPLPRHFTSPPCISLHGQEVT